MRRGSGVRRRGRLRRAWTGLRTLLGGGRPSGGPPGWSRALLAGAVALGLALPAAGWWWLRDAGDPAAVLAEARDALGVRIPLDSALRLTWNRTLALSGDGRGMEASGRPHAELLLPDVPPAICRTPPGGGRRTADPAIADDAARLADLLSGVVTDRERSRAAEILISWERAPAPAAPGRFLQAYNAARAYLILGDPASANRELGRLPGPVDDVVPVLDHGAEAPRLLRAGRATLSEAALAFHLRYLRGLVALRRGLGADAIAQYRIALNAVTFFSARRGPGAGHHRRTSVPLGELGCGRGSGAPELDSLDAYLGLVAAYVWTPDFTDPGRFRREVARDVRRDIEPDDPFLPLLRHAAERGAAGTAVPAHLVWAVSNLQRVTHANRLPPAPRLEAARGVLALELAGRPAALEAVPGLDGCSLLAGAARGLRRAARDAREVTPVHAAASVLVFGRLGARCPEADPRPEAAVRSRWLLAAGERLAGGTPSRLEELRLRLERELARPTPSRDELAGVLAAAASWRRVLAGGRRPAALPGVEDPAGATRLIADWRRALFSDVAEALGRSLRPGAPGADLTPLAVRRRVPAAHAAAAHAGLAPSDLYRWGDVRPSLAGLALGERALLRARYLGRSAPWAAAAVLLLVSGAWMLLALLTYVWHWRCRLALRPLYREELAAEGRRAARSAEPKPRSTRAPELRSARRRSVPYG